MGALDGTGGDLILVGGAGLTSGGDVHLSGGDGQNVEGGDFVLTGGNGFNLGGELIFKAGTGVDRNGGNIAIGTQGPAGDITLSARGGNSGGSDEVTINADPNGIVTWNGTPVLKNTQDIDTPDIPTFNAAAPLATTVTGLSRDFNDILQALNQCGHGLVVSVTQPDNIPQTCQTP